MKLPGVTHEFVFTHIAGDNTAPTAHDWTRRNHELSYTHTVAGKAAAQVATKQVGTRFDGKVTSKAFDLTVDEHHQFVIVIAAGKKATSKSKGGGGSQSATQFVDTCRNTLRSGGATYKWVDAVTVRAFYEHLPSRPMTDWKASGSILKDGEPYGKITYLCEVNAKLWQRVKRRYHGRLLLLLDTPDEVIVLESYRAPGGLFR